MLLVGGLLSAVPLRAVYAPIPEQEQGKDLLVTVRGGVSHDTNLFGAASGAVASTIFSLAPRVSYNRSLTDQTFFSAGYGLALDYFRDRPGDKLLDSHDASVRLAHAFSRSTTIDIFETLSISRNPESALPGVGALPGVTLNPDQSFTRNQIDGRFTTPITPKASLTAKARSIYYEYRNDILGRSLDRIENLYGLAGDYAVLPELKVVGEYRHQDVYYRKLGEEKNKSSDYLMGGVDYNVAKKMSLSGRLGGEWRTRENEPDTTSPYAEFSGKYDFSERSFLVGGYAYTLEETSDTLRFTDSQVHRFFANVQHALTPLIVASGSATFEPAVLQGRRGQADVDEDTTRLGVAVSYLPNPKWTLSVSYDYDRVDSEDAPRNMRRERVALNASYAF
jgi:opacity protein-like surface antigen